MGGDGPAAVQRAQRCRRRRHARGSGAAAFLDLHLDARAPASRAVFDQFNFTTDAGARSPRRRRLVEEFDGELADRGHRARRGGGCSMIAEGGRDTGRAAIARTCRAGSCGRGVQLKRDAADVVTLATAFSAAMRALATLPRTRCRAASGGKYSFTPSPGSPSRAVLGIGEAFLLGGIGDERRLHTRIGHVGRAQTTKLAFHIATMRSGEAGRARNNVLARRRWSAAAPWDRSSSTAARVSSFTVQGTMPPTRGRVVFAIGKEGAPPRGRAPRGGGTTPTNPRVGVV